MSTSLTRKQLHDRIRQLENQAKSLQQQCFVLEFVARLNAETIHHMSQENAQGVSVSEGFSKE